MLPSRLKHPFINEEELKRNADTKLKNRKIIENGHWLWRGALFKNGYGMVCLNGVTRKVHRVSGWLYLGLPSLESYIQVLHKPPCEIKRCYNPEHLYLGDILDNGKDYSDSIKAKSIFPCGCLKEGNIYKEKIGGGNTRDVCNIHRRYRITIF